MCRMKTAEWVRIQYEANQGIPDIEDIGTDSDLCKYYEGFIKKQDDVLLNKGIYTLDDLKELGREKNVCPYYLVRHVLCKANIIGT